MLSYQHIMLKPSGAAIGADNILGLVVERIEKRLEEP